jgi:hypothetical protein
VTITSSHQLAAPLVLYDSTTSSVTNTTSRRLQPLVLHLPTPSRCLQAYNRHDRALSQTDNSPAPVSELETQDPEYFLKRAGGKPIYDEGEPKVGPWISAFTRRREIFAGRIAMVGWLVVYGD